MLASSAVEAGNGDRRYRELLAEYDRASMAASVAWEAFLAAHKPTRDGTGATAEDFKLRFHNASVFRLAAEQALLAYLKEHGKLTPSKKQRAK